jgi:sphinganine-1-phosphate aldolase
MPASLFDAIVKLNFESVAAQLYASLPREEGEICYLTLLEHAIVFFVVQRTLSDTTALVRREGLGGLYKRTAGVILSFAKAAIPGVSGLVAGEEKKALADLEKDLLGEGDPDAMPTMPAEGFSVKEVERRVMKMQAEEVAAAGGKKWAGIYHESHGALDALQSRVWSAYASTNALYPGVFPSLRKFEAEIVSMVLGIVHGHECGAVGLLASGGTESVLLAALAYRQAGRAKGIARPRIIACISCHPAITKAAAYFDFELVKVPYDPKTLRMVPEHVKPYINGSTVAIYASAPS